MEKRRKIFDDGAATIEEVTVKKNKKPELAVNDGSFMNSRSSLKKTIKVEDIIDTFAGYLPSQANFMPKDGGECLICGKETTSSMRKICFDCLQRHGDELYNKAKNAIENGNKEFNI